MAHVPVSDGILEGRGLDAIFFANKKRKSHLGIGPSKIEWDLTNGPLRKLLELLDTQV